ncbi:MAG: hypothetical protein Fur0041_20330 [Bacteroidia bacterium]
MVYSGEKFSNPSDHAVFRNYMNEIFMYAGTLSLEKEMRQVPVSSVMPGDIFIKGGSPGHAVTVVSVAVNKEGKRIFMLAQSYMPAQEMHVLKNPNNTTISPWYPADFGNILETPEWDFNSNQLRRFQ